MLSVVLGVLLVTMTMALARAVRGPTVYDRIMAANMFGTVTTVLLAVLSFAVERLDFLDIALIYALLNFVGTTAALRFVEQRVRARQAREAAGGGGS